MNPRPIAVVNLDYLAPTSTARQRLRASGYEVVEITDALGAAVQVLPAVDRRFEAAKAAMQGLIMGMGGNLPETMANGDFRIRTTAELSRGFADALLAELDKTK